MYSITVAVAICAGLVFGHAASPPPADAGSGSCQSEMNAFPLEPGSKCCTTAGGHSADILYQQPWAVLIDYERKKGGTSRMCAGTLISARYALTAAQCTTGLVLSLGTPTSVRLGDYDLNHKGNDCVAVDGAGEQCNDGAISIAIETIIPHPEYNGQANHNDIALIRLKEAAPYTDFIRPVCLPTKNLQSSPPASPLVAVSWYKDPDNKDIKRILTLPFVDHEKCQTIYSHPGRNANISKDLICAGGVAGMDTCKGDGGGPLVYENQGTSELIGTVSFGPSPCGQEDIPSVYTNIYKYVDWIKSHIVA